MVQHNAKIDRSQKGKVILKLILQTDILEIILTEDKPNEIKTVFNKLILHLKNGLFSFNLEDSNEDLYHYVCKEYIKQLNTDINSTYKELESNDLLNQPENTSV